MPLIFSYGSLRREDVQLETFGRRLVGEPDSLPGWGATAVEVEDPGVRARFGATHDNATFTGRPESHIDGVVFEISEEELARVDRYEVPFAYVRVAATLASGRVAWVYHRPSPAG